MQAPLQIEFQNMDRSDAVAARMRERAEKLERFFPCIIGCRVTVVAPHRHRRHDYGFVELPNGPQASTTWPPSTVWPAE